MPYTGPAAEAFVKDMSKLLSRASHSVEGMQTDTMREHVLGQLHECEGASSGSSDATQAAAASALTISELVPERYSVCLIASTLGSLAACQSKLIMGENA